MKTKIKNEYCQHCGASAILMTTDICIICGGDIGYTEYCSCSSSEVKDCNTCEEV